MATFLNRLGRLAFRRRRLVALLWVALLAVAGFGAMSASGTTSNEFSIPGTQAQKAFDLLEQRFPGSSADGATARIVVKAPAGQKVTDAPDKAAVERLVADVKASSPEVATVTDPYQTGSVSKDGTIAYATASYKASSAELGDGARDALKDAAQTGRDAGLTVEIGGDALTATPEAAATEVIGVAIAAIVLAVTFGSLVAAGLPLLTALIGVGIGVATIFTLAPVLDLSSTTSTLAMMIGLAVGIDYALFIVSRYRSERAAGRDPLTAAGLATGTAGTAVVFAGLTVIIALAGLAVVGIPMLTKMGLAAAGTVAIAVAIAVTLIPALLGFAGDKILSRKARRSDTGPAHADAKPGLGVRWARFVLRRPVAVLLATVAALGVLAIPVTSMDLNLPDDGSQPTSTTQRRAYDLLSEGFGPGFNGPLMVVVDAQGNANPTALATEVRQTVSRLPDVTTVGTPVFNQAGDTATMTVIPSSGPSTEQTTDLVKQIRAQTGEDVMVTGQTAMNIDVSDKIDAALVPYLAVVVGLAFVLLMLVFRSILVPLKAAGGFLLSVLAALGSVVAVFQWGWLAGLFGVEQTGPIMSLMPIFLVGVVFGLAMDYEVFLVTRMREAYVHGESPKQAVVTGFRHGARVVVAAAIIMISVFAGFIGSSESMVKMIGFGLAAAVLLDAFVVRMALVPAVLALLDRRAWWLPRWLDRLLPDVDVEGERLHRELTEADRPSLEKQAQPV